MMTKAALRNVLDVRTAADTSDGRSIEIASGREGVLHRLDEFGAEGLRTLGIGSRHLDGRVRISRDDEAEMTFLGVLAFADPPRVVSVRRSLVSRRSASH